MPPITGLRAMRQRHSQPFTAGTMAVRQAGLLVALALPLLTSEVSAQERPQAPASASASHNQRAAAAQLPAPLQQSASRYPVSLYASPDCNGCKLGRELLERRGIPYQEYRIASPEEQRAASNLGISTLPHLMIGTQALKGYDSQDWANYLSAAGYPEKSALPANYQAPAVKSVLPAPSAPPLSASGPSELSSAPDTNESSSADPAASQGFRF